MLGIADFRGQYMEIFERNIAEEWYQYGLKSGDDFFMRFMMHWIGFNWLYNQIGGSDERTKIKDFYNQNRKKFDKVDPFNLTDINVFLEGAVFDVAKVCPHTRDYEKLKEYNVEEGKVEIISVEGNTSFDSYDYFSTDAKVVISHH